MSAEDSKQPGGTPVVPAEAARGSGEGAATALKALIKKRNMGEAPDSPAPSAPPSSHPQP